jgi:4-amino-4-deoxy-L-arabinose transferase-like glycosyltransferase
LRPRSLEYPAYALLAIVLLAYSQTIAFHWDEGFHLLAARFIAAGRRPYLDFIFAQTPLNAYWTAAWFRVFGESWRLAHVLAALATWSAVLLVGRYLLARFPAPEWRAPAALVGVLLFGFLQRTVVFGTLAQPYGFCTFFVVAAFRAAVSAREHPRLWRSVAAGALAGAAAAASLLTAAVAPVILIWLWMYSPARNRWAKATAFVGGALIPAAPVLWLFAWGPRQVWFDLVQYHALYRHEHWQGATLHDIEVISSWLQDTQAFLLIVLAAVGWMFVRRSGWDAGVRSEFRLCVWLVLAVSAMNVTAHPTFSQYFLFVVPFLAVLACIGFFAVVSQLGYAGRPRYAVGLLGCFMMLALARGIYQERDNYSWPKLTPIAHKLNQVAPPKALVLTQEPIYFLSGREVPYGLEFGFAQKLNLGARQNTLFHILPQADLDREIKAQRFAAAAICDDGDRESHIEDLHVFPKTFESGDCTVLWRSATAPKSPMVK